MRTVRHLSAAAALAVASVAANAVTTYSFGVSGTQVHLRDDWECPGSVCPPGSPSVIVSDWSGLFLLTAPNGNGTFTFDGSLAEPNLTLVFDQGGFSTAFSFGLPRPGGQPPVVLPFSATISDGALTALNGGGHLFNVLPPGYWMFDGTRVTFDNPAQHHYGQTFGSGTMALPSAAVPEPETWAMFAAGLLVLVRIARRHSG